MTLWIIFAVMTAAAFTFLLRPLRISDKKIDITREESDVYKDQLSELDRDIEDGLVARKDAEAARTEISRRILDTVLMSRTVDPSVDTGVHKKTILALLFFVPTITLSLYLSVGEPNYARVTQKQQSTTQGTQKETLEVLTQRVEEHLKTNPNDLKGWLVLARAYTNMGRKEEAKRAFENIFRIRENSSDIASLPKEQRGLMIKAMVAGLHQKLKENGDNIDGWERLMRSYMVLGQKQDAVASYLEAREAMSDDKGALKKLSSSAAKLGILQELEKLQ